MPELKSVPEPPLEQTLTRAAEGDEAAWRRLVTAYSGRVYGLLLRQCRDRELAEELTQAAFVKVAATLGRGTGGGTGASTGGASYEERGQFESWLFRIALNGLRDEMRRRGRQARSVDMSPGTARELDHAGTGAAAHAATQRALAQRAEQRGDDPAELADRAERIEWLRHAVTELSEPEQRVLHLRHTAGLGFAQIAETLAEPLGTVLARNHRAIAKLRKRMAQRDGE